MGKLPVVYLFFLCSILGVSCGEKELTIPNTETSIFFFNEKGTEEVNKIVTLKNGDLLFVGMSDNNGFAMRVSPSGKRQWYKSYQGEISDKINDAAELSNGNIVLVGHTTSDPKTEKNIAGWIIGISSVGDKIWEHVNYDGYDSKLLGVMVTEDDDIIAVGYDAPSSARVLVCRYKSDGSLFYKRSHDIGPWHDVATDVCLSPEGNYIITGNTSPNNLSTENGKFNTFLMELKNTQGSINWVNLNQTLVTSIWKDRTGYTTVLPSSEGYYWATTKADKDSVDYIQVCKTDFSGSVIKSKKIYGNHYAFFRGMSATSSGEIIVCGETRDDFASEFVSNYFINKLDGNLEKVWITEVGTAAHKQAACGASEHRGKVIVGGYTQDEIGVRSLAMFNLSANGEFNK